ncbi:unnamed protein product [Rotaria sordida]|uniref:G-protein coupled receptors family 1 profile domain-containing protein n=1 Tax=Rotaria sordida TaxID=392033 RepID=A0A814A515_9BILA|nr:unnamed protein product [Rotaria sordida]CAF1559945.1 unnamed protein product [Rotaria sordida]
MLIISVSLSDIARVSEVLLNMDKYMIVILYIIGTLGAILNIITFLQKQIRRNSCSFYFLSSSIIDFCIMNVFILMEIITTFNKSLSDLIYSTNIWCKVGNYIMFILPCLSSSYIILASIDRFCISSLNQTFRKWSNLKISRIIVIIVFIIWIIFSLHIPIVYNRIRDPLTNITRCSVQIGSPTTFLIIDGFFFSLYKGAITPFLLCIFGLLIYYNMKRSRARVMPQTLSRSNRTTTAQISSITPIIIVQNRKTSHMLTMLLVQVLLTIILNIPYMVIYLFGFFNQIPKDLFQLLLYIMFSFIARWFYYMNYCKTFYINTLTSKLFRNSLRQQFLDLFHKHQMIMINN